MGFMIRGLAAVAAALALHGNALAAGRPALAKEVDRLRQLLEARDYRSLDRLETRWRNLGIVLSDGQPARGAYFYAISCYCSLNTGQEKFREVAALDARMKEWRRRFPQSRTARLGPAIVALKHAWAFRGESAGGHVSNADRRAFDDYVERARLDLEAIRAEMADEPEWFAKRLEVARLQAIADAEYWALFREATERHPRYLPLYFEGLRRSSGSAEARKRYVEEVSQGTRSWLGEALYAMMNWSVVDEASIASGLIDWKRMKASFNELVERYPDEWNLNRYASASCRARDFKTLERVLPRIRGNVMLEAWENNMAVYVACAARAPARD